MASSSVLVVGAGISGLACARALAAAGISVKVVDRGRRPGGRMSSRRLEGRPVDIGASYFTAAAGSAFRSVVDDWLARGLAREWTDTFAVAGPDGIRETRTGPMRYAAPTGLRELVADLATGLEVEQDWTVGTVERGGVVDGESYDAVVLAMPDPQAKRLLAPDAAARGVLDDAAGWLPTLAVVLGWEERPWPKSVHGAFVNGSAVLSFVADDGDRRGDGASVLVAHSTPEFARQHLDDPDAAIGPVSDAVMTMLGLVLPPDFTFAHRWTFARPAAPHPEPFYLGEGIGVCGDGWGGTSSVGAAWTSGDALGRELAARMSSAR